MTRTNIWLVLPGWEPLEIVLDDATMKLILAPGELPPSRNGALILQPGSKEQAGAITLQDKALPSTVEVPSNTPVDAPAVE